MKEHRYLYFYHVHKSLVTVCACISIWIDSLFIACQGTLLLFFIIKCLFSSVSDLFIALFILYRRLSFVWVLYLELSLSGDACISLRKSVLRIVLLWSRCPNLSCITFFVPYFSLMVFYALVFVRYLDAKKKPGKKNHHVSNSMAGMMVIVPSSMFSVIPINS